MKQMMMKEASNSSTSNISTSNERDPKTLQSIPPQESQTLSDTFDCLPSTSKTFDTRDSMSTQTPSTTPIRKHRSSKVLFDYVSQNVDELDIAVGETVEILDKQSDGWYRVRKTSDQTSIVPEGLVPGNYLKEIDTKISKSGQKLHVNSLLHKKSLSASEANEIRMMMTMLSGKQATEQNGRTSGNLDRDSDETNKIKNVYNEIEVPGKDNAYVNTENNENNDVFKKLKDDDLIRHAIEYWSITRGSWLHVDVALDRKMAVLFVRIT